MFLCVKWVGRIKDLQDEAAEARAQLLVKDGLLKQARTHICPGRAHAYVHLGMHLHPTHSWTQAWTLGRRSGAYCVLWIPLQHIIIYQFLDRQLSFHMRLHMHTFTRIWFCVGTSHAQMDTGLDTWQAFWHILLSMNSITVYHNILIPWQTAELSFHMSHLSLSVLIASPQAQVAHARLEDELKISRREVQKYVAYCTSYSGQWMPCWLCGHIMIPS